jgi:hypothetical protein
MQQQYRLRLGDGTLLLVDRDALNAWLVDERAMVQQVRSKRWKSLRQFIKDEKEAAYFAPAPAAAPPAANPNDPPRATRLEDVLVPPPPKIKPGAAPPALPVEEPPLLNLAPALAPELPIELSAEAPPTLNEPLKVTNMPFVPVEDESPRAVAPPSLPPVPPAPAPPVAEENLFSSLQSMADTTLAAPPPVEPEPVAAAPAPAVEEEEVVVQEEEVWTPPEAEPEPEPPPLTEEELELTRPRMTLQEIGKPPVPARTPAAKKKAAPAPAPTPPPPSMWREPEPPAVPEPEPEPEPEPVRMEPVRMEPVRMEPEPMRAPEPIRLQPSRPELQVLADAGAGREPRPRVDDTDGPVIALKPFDDEPAPELFEPEPDDLYTPPPPRTNVVDSAKTMVGAWGGMIQGWVDALDSRSPKEKARQEKPAPDLDLEPLELIEERATPARPRDGLLTLARRRAAVASAALSGFAGAAAENVSGWLRSLRRERAALSLSLPPPERREPASEPIAGPLDEDFRDEAPAPPPRVRPAPPTPALKPPPSFNEMPVIRLAPIVETAPEPEDVYDGDDGPGLLDRVGGWAKHVVLATLVVIFAFVAGKTWQTWLPRAGNVGVTVVGEIENRVRPPRDAVADALARATTALPHLSGETISLILERRGLLDPVGVFHAAQEALAVGVPTLTAAEAQELAFLRRELAATLSPVEQVQLRDYDRVRRVVPSAAEGSVIALLAEGVGNLSPQRQERLQLLNAKAVAAGLPSQPILLSEPSAAAATTGTP